MLLSIHILSAERKGLGADWDRYRNSGMERPWAAAMCLQPRFLEHHSRRQRLQLLEQRDSRDIPIRRQAIVTRRRYSQREGSILSQGGHINERGFRPLVLTGGAKI